MKRHVTLEDRAKAFWAKVEKTEGHIYTKENTWMYKNRRHCRKCSALRTARYRAQRKEG